MYCGLIMKKRCLLIYIFLLFGLTVPIYVHAASIGLGDQPKMIYKTKVSATASIGYEVGNFFDVQGGISVGHFRMLNTDEHQLSIAWFRHTYEFQYDFLHSSYGISASAGYSYFALHADINLNYRWDRKQNQCFSIGPMFGFDIGLCALRLGPQFYLHNDFTSTKVAFAITLDFFLPGHPG